MSVACFAALVSFSVIAAPFTVTSETVKEGKSLSNAQVFDGMGCTGGNQSPQLSWKNAPEGTKSFAVTIYDPDAPTGSGWWHWVVYDIPATTTSLPADLKNQAPEGAKLGRTDFGAKGFGGACPPPKDKAHRYVITVFALKVDTLEVPDDATAAMIGFFLNANALGRAKLTATFKR